VFDQTELRRADDREWENQMISCRDEPRMCVLDTVGLPDVQREDRRSPIHSSFGVRPMVEPDGTDLAVQRCLNQMAQIPNYVDVQQIVRELLSVAAERLGTLCGLMLRRSYPRLARGPFNVDPDELLSAVVERMIKAMRIVRPTHCRQFFALANQHIRWELNELARDLESNMCKVPLSDTMVGTPSDHTVELSPRACHILKAINSLPESDREIFELVRLQGMSQSSAAEILGISVKTVQRRLNRVLPWLSQRLCDLEPVETEPQRPVIEEDPC
jgi:RNA polymerase sigma factor (sigma-70 family)